MTRTGVGITFAYAKAQQRNGTLSLKGDACVTNHELDLGSNMTGYITPLKTEIPLSTVALFILMALVFMFITWN